MNVLTVTQVNTYIKALLDEIPQIRNIYISGEISNFKHYYNSGHMYFTLKDSKSQLKCVMFSNDNYKLKFTPENGMKIICFGQVGVYERDGVYQMYVRDMHCDGAGDLTIAYEQLKLKLEEEGLFSDLTKKPIPKFPKKIGIATSKMGAAVEDIKNVISRRYPLCDIIIVPTIVQGDSASADIVKSIEFLDNMPDIDTIIVGRGGGSIEDLWAFNTEIVARAVYNCKTPIISAVGHETDFTICDFVADLRAPTPSAGAELAVPDIKSLIINLNNISISIEKAMDYKIESAQNRLTNVKNSSGLSNKAKLIESGYSRIEQYKTSINKAINSKVEFIEQQITSYAKTLNALSPLNIISRGYLIASNDNGVIKSVNDTKIDDDIILTVADGKVLARVTEVNKNAKE
jgi:exodeoxyribonuclease VII large subunit